MEFAWLICADRSVRYGWEQSSTDRCALLLRSLLAIGNDIAVLLRVTGGLDLVGILGGIRCSVLLEVSSSWVDAGGVGGIAGEVGVVVAGAGVPIERVILLFCSGVAVDCDGVFCCVRADDGGSVVGCVGAGTVAGWLVYLIGIGGSSSSLLLK